MSAHFEIPSRQPSYTFISRLKQQLYYIQKSMTGLRTKLHSSSNSAHRNDIAMQFGKGMPSVITAFRQFSFILRNWSLPVSLRLVLIGHDRKYSFGVCLIRVILWTPEIG